MGLGRVSFPNATAQAKSWHPPAPVVQQPWQVHWSGGAFVLLPVDPSRSRHSRPAAGKISSFKRKGSQLLEMTPVWSIIWSAQLLRTFHYMRFFLYLCIVLCPGLLKSNLSLRAKACRECLLVKLLQSGCKASHGQNQGQQQTNHHPRPATWSTLVPANGQVGRRMAENAGASSTSAVVRLGQ